MSNVNVFYPMSKYEHGLIVDASVGQTFRSARTIARKANRFDTLGMQGLFETEEAVDSKRLLPAHVRRAIAELQAAYPAFHPHELARICYVRFCRRPGARTIKRVLAEEPLPTVVGRRFPSYGEIPDPVERRVVELAALRRPRS
ncbi:MAG: helix-turn-helix domain-containing protein [Gemmatimonadales bacterium]